MNEIVHEPTVSEFRRMAEQLGYEKVKHGHFYEHDDGKQHCSVCSAYKIGYKRFCSYCGAKMDGDEK